MVVLVGLGMSATALGEARLVAATGGATTRSHTSLPWRPMAVGKALRLGQVLTCSQSCSLRLASGALVELKPGAAVRPLSPRFFRFEAHGAMKRCSVV